MMGANPLNHREMDIPPVSAAVSAGATKASTHATVPPVVRYDFRNPKRISQGLLHALQNLHAAFARDFSTALSALVRNPIDVKLLGIDQTSLREFFVRLENPTCLCVLQAASLPEPWIVDIQPSVLYPMIDCMLGGADPVAVTTRRPPTEIELRLAGRIGELLCGELRRAWQGVADLPCTVLRIESNPRTMQAVSADDSATVVRFGLSLGPRRGIMRLCLPGKSMEPIRNRLADDEDESPVAASALPENAERIGREVAHSQAEIEVWLAESQINTQELLGLRVGDIITTNQEINDPVVVAVGGIPKFHAKPGAVKGSKSIVITEPLKEGGS
jgi:flagellar motor switch protein FliM